MLSGVLLLTLTVSLPVFAQQRGAAAPSQPAPRTAEGKVDLSGVWQGGGLGFTLGTDATPAPTGGRGGVVATYKPEAYAKVQEYVARRGIDDPMARCLMVGVPRITSMPMPFQIIQMPNQVIFHYESFHVFRLIPTDGRKHPEDHDPSFMGDSVGRWEGDTLVVDVIGFNEKTWLGPVGSFHSDALHVIERYTRTSNESITYEVTIEDPKVLTKPFTARGTIRLLPGDRVREYECGENNEDIQRLEKLLENESLFRRK